MLTKTWRTLSAFAVAGLVAAQPAVAHAPSPAVGAGEDMTVTLLDARVADGNFLARFAVTGVMEGTFDGTYAADVAIVVHANGRVEANGLLTFTGSIAGCGVATVDFRLVATGAFPATGGPAVVEGRLVAVGPGIEASLGFDEVGSLFTYQGSYHCGG